MRIHSGGLQWLDGPLFIAMECHASRNPAPEIQDFRQMMDLRVLLRNAQHELEILNPIEPRIETAQLLDKTSTNDQQMPDEHHASKHLQRPVRLKEGLDGIAVRSNISLIGVERVNGGISF